MVVAITNLQSAENKSELRLAPLIDPIVQQFLAKPELLRSLRDGFGGPLHLLFPEIFRATVDQYRGLLNSLAIPHQILFAKKANKSAAFIQECAYAGIGVDVASVEELAQALKGGISPAAIGISGPAKSRHLLLLAVQHGCLVAIDALDELKHAIACAQNIGRKLRILIRVHPDNHSGSRFGIAQSNLSDIWDEIEGHSDALHLEGLSFHLSGYDLKERAQLAAKLINIAHALRHRFPHCRLIDIGGGIPISYVRHDDWSRFKKNQSSDDFHAGKLFGADYYPYHSTISGVASLEHILTVPLQDGTDLKSLLLSYNMELAIEPGRALLDQAGVSLFSIQGVKDEQGYGLITVDGTSFSLSEQWFNSEFAPDPLLISSQIEPEGQSLYRAAIGGASCLDSDMLTWRKIVFPRRPVRGDLLCYVNTAGYQMDSNESEFHNIPVPQKLCLFTRDGTPSWCLDSVYCAMSEEGH